MPLSAPVIGITADLQNPGLYADYPWFALRENYITAVRNCGATALILPCDNRAAQQYASLIDGLIISGGDFDILPSYYGEEIASDFVKINSARTEFEMYMAQFMVAANKPILGICGGEQLINVLYKGSLIQHLPDVLGNDSHRQSIPKHMPSHEIVIAANTLLARIVKVDSYMVNSTHHQAVAKCGIGIAVNAMSRDGIIEGIEHTKLPFCLGVQWHPEYSATVQDIAIFQAFVWHATARL